MSDAAFYIKLYKEDTAGGSRVRAFSVQVPRPHDVDALAKAVKALAKLDCDYWDIVVYAAGTPVASPVQFPNADPLSGGDNLPGDTKANPLVVVVPKKEALNDAANAQHNQEPGAEPGQNEMEKFFKNTQLSDLHFVDGSDLFIEVAVLSWTQADLGALYWRSCYSYIFCSTIAFFEDAYSKYSENKKAKKPAFGRSMVLTGVKGTGKSVVGAIIALVLGKAFGWRVTYTWNGKNVFFGELNSDKRIHTLDHSVGNSAAPEEKFALHISSANNARWKDDVQQGNWSEIAGNFLFTDTVPVDELMAMAKHQETSREDAEANYNLAGGVARICLDDPSIAKDKILGALKDPSFDLATVVGKMAELDDQPLTAGSKFYPGLLVHIHPTSPFRNHAAVAPCSPAIANEFSRIVNQKDEREIESLMASLLKISKARGFAGLIWEPLFTLKAKKDLGTLVIVGCELPAKDKKVDILLSIDCANIETITYKKLDDLKAILSSKVNGAVHGKVLVAKAEADNFIAIDAVLLKVDGTKLSLVGLQMTVASSTHALMEKAVINLVAVADYLLKHHGGYDVSIEIWFLQPKDCLENGFNLTSLQPLTLEKKDSESEDVHMATETGAGESAGAGEGADRRKRKRRKKSTNNRNLWNEDAQRVTQHIAIASFAPPGTAATQPTSISDGIRACLEAELKQEDNSTKPSIPATLREPTPPEPTLRRWRSTMETVAKLEAKGIPHTLVVQIKFDLLSDQYELKQMGLIDEVSDQPLAATEASLAAEDKSKRRRGNATGRVPNRYEHTVVLTP